MSYDQKSVRHYTFAPTDVSGRGSQRRFGEKDESPVFPIVYVCSNCLQELYRENRGLDDDSPLKGIPVEVIAQFGSKCPNCHGEINESGEPDVTERIAEEGETGIKLSHRDESAEE